MNLPHRAARQHCRRVWLLAIGLTATLGSAGCTRTVVGGYTDSPDKTYRVYGRIYGAYGRSFLENTPKTVRISIVTAAGNETLLLRKEYRVQGYDVGWDAAWDEHHNLTVALFEYPAGTSRWDLTKKGSPTNHIRSVTYRFDSKGRTFTEESAK